MSLKTEPNDSMVGHLTELRKRIIYIFYSIFAGFLASWSVSEKIFDIARKPIEAFLPTGGLVFTAPMDKFLAHLKVSLLSSVIISSPLWVYQIWKFIEPGLYKDEKKFGYVFIFFGSTLFTVGVSFVYFVVYPMAFKFLMNFGGGTDQPMITMSEYLSFFTTTTIIFGLAFEMPLFLSILGKLGIINRAFLRKYRRFAVVLLAALSALFTPPDVVSMLLMMGPMLTLYEISILLVPDNKPESKPDL